MPSRPIPGSTGEVLTCLPSPYLPHGETGLLYLPRFLAKCKYVKEHGSLPASYAKNFKRGLDRFLCLHLGIDPNDVEKIVREASDDAPLVFEAQKGVALEFVEAGAAGWAKVRHRDGVAGYVRASQVWGL